VELRVLEPGIRLARKRAKADRRHRQQAAVALALTRDDPEILSAVGAVRHEPYDLLIRLRHRGHGKAQEHPGGDQDQPEDEGSVRHVSRTAAWNGLRDLP